MTTAPDHANDHDVLDVLATDHREAEELLGQIRTTSEPEQRRDLTDAFISEMVRHAVAEETYLYPTMKAHLPEADEAVDHDVKEHQELEELFKELERADVATPEFDLLLGRVEETLADHISDEEDDQFPLIRRGVPAEVLVDLKDKVQSLKKVAPTRPHPSTPRNQLFHMLVGPGVGLVDRARDKLTGRNA